MTESSNTVELEFYRKMAALPDLAAFVSEHSAMDTSRLLFQARDFKTIPMPMVVNQILGRQKAKTKIPTYFSHQGILYPPVLNLEQSSSEKTARLKARLLAEANSNAGGKLVDLTGGFGIDTYFFSRVFSDTAYVEPNGVLMWIARHNHHCLKALNISYHNETAAAFLDHAPACDAVYLDPSRRVNSGKVIHLDNCEPALSDLQERIFKISPLLLLKTSPLLDITEALREVLYVWMVYVVSVDQECRELLFLSRRGFAGEPRIQTIHLNRDVTETFDFLPSDEKASNLAFGPVRKYLYEPNPSIMKAGAFKSVAQKFSLQKIHPNSHFFSSDTLLTDFPGRIFEVESRIRSDGRELASLLPDGKANVLVRNYPLSAEQLKKRLRLSDGGSQYVIGTTSLAEGKIVLLASRRR